MKLEETLRELEASVEKTVETQKNNFMKENGKYAALGFFYLLSYIFGFAELATSEILSFIIGIITLISIIVIILIEKHSVKCITENKLLCEMEIDLAKADMVYFAKTQVAIVDLFNEEIARSERKLANRLSSLEDNAEYIYIEQELSDGKLVHANKKFFEIFGVTIEDLNAKVVEQPEHYTKPVDIIAKNLIHPDDRDLIGEISNKRTMGDRGVKEYELYLIRADGSAFPGRIKSTVIDNNGHSLIQLFIYDLLEERRKDEALDAYRTLTQDLVKRAVLVENRKEQYSKLLRGLMKNGK